MPFTCEPRYSTPSTRGFEHWLVVHKEHLPTTVRDYMMVVEQFVGRHPSADTLPAEPDAPVGRAPKFERWIAETDLDWSTIGLDELERYVTAWVADSSRPPSNQMRRKRVYGLRSFFSYLLSHDRVARNLAVELQTGKRKQGKPKPVADDAWVTLWGGDMPIETRVWLGLGYYFGLRRAETILVQPQHFDLSERLIVGFPRKGSKQGSVMYGFWLEAVALRLPHLADRLDEFEAGIEFLCSARESGERLLPMVEDVDPLAASRLNKMLTTMCKMRGIAPITPHQLRHSFGTNAFRCGLPIEFVADQMSHSSVDTTRGYVNTEMNGDVMLQQLRQMGPEDRMVGSP